MQAASAPPREPFETNRHYVRNPHNGEWNLSIHAMIDGRVLLTTACLSARKNRANWNGNRSASLPRTP